MFQIRQKNIAQRFLGSNSGYTLLEMIVTLAIFILILGGTMALYTDTLRTNTVLTGNLNAQMQVRNAFTSMLADIRSASSASNGAYAIDTASSTYFAFYSDINNDGLQEKIRYFLSGKTLKIGIIKPTGNPSVYNTANEVVNTLISDVANTPAQPVFSYFDSSYEGASAPLSNPVNVSAVRLIKIDVLIDHTPNQAPGPLEFTTQVSIRNLKDNL